MYGFNILAQSVHDRARLYADIERVRPAYVVVMDEPSVAEYIRTRFGWTNVIYRAYHPSDHEAYKQIAPHGWLAEHERFAVGDTMLYVLNEPDTYRDNRPLARWLADICVLASQRGIRLCVGNFGMGHPDERRLLAGEFDDLLRVLARQREHVLGVHEYAHASMRDERPYHIGRFGYWIQRARQIGVTPPRIVVTEHGRDVGGGVDDGWRAVLSEEQYVQLLASGTDIYKNAVEGVCVFCYGRGGGDRWRNFDVSDAEIVKRWMNEVNMSMEMPTATYKPARAVPRGNYSVNVRAKPSTGASVIAQIAPAGETVGWGGIVNGWHALRLGDGREGYASDTVLAVTLIAPPDDHIYVPLPELRLLPAHVSTLANVLEAIAAAVRSKVTT